MDIKKLYFTYLTNRQRFICKPETIHIDPKESTESALAINLALDKSDFFSEKQFEQKMLALMG